MIEHDLLAYARGVIAAHLDGRPIPPVDLPPPYTTSRGVFVTLWQRDGGLRGCIGHIAPIHARLADEIADCAWAAASQDPRFPPVATEELEGLSLELSLLEPPEPVRDLRDLDPQRYGVVVSCRGRRGVLLPGIDGVDTVDDQIAIARRKGHIHADEPWTVERFQIRKISEET